MSNEKHLYHIVGREVISTFVGSRVSGNKTEYIAPLSNFWLEKMNNNRLIGETVVFDPSYCYTEGDVVLNNVRVNVSECRPATDAEIVLFDNAMAAHNLVYESRVAKERKPDGSVVKRKPLFAPYYKRKGDFTIVLNGKPITFNSFKRKGLKEGELVILHGDNGYSHCWSETLDGKCLREFIDTIFDRKITDPRKHDTITHRHKRAAVGQLCGWNFDQWGRLVVNTTFKPHRFDEVSNS